MAGRRWDCNSEGLGALHWRKILESHWHISFLTLRWAGCSVFLALNSGKREYVHGLQDKSRLDLCAMNGEWRIVCTYLG
jgi:hypothetical protein